MTNIARCLLFGIINELKKIDMKYYFFRDLDNNSNTTDNGTNYHAAGYVNEVRCELDSSKPTDRDLAVSFFSPFKGFVELAWRSIDEVELFEVEKWEYDQLVEEYKDIKEFLLSK